MKDEAAEKRGPLQLLDSLMVRCNPSGLPPQGVVSLPSGFLEELAAKQEADGNMEGLRDLVLPVGEWMINTMHIYA